MEVNTYLICLDTKQLNNTLKHRGVKQMPRIDIRLSEEEKQKAQVQANKLGLTVSEYLRFIINIDSVTNIISKLKGEK